LSYDLLTVFSAELGLAASITIWTYRHAYNQRN